VNRAAPLLSWIVTSRLARALGALLLLAASSAPAAAAPAGAPPATTYQFADPGQALAFEGKGWGHGVGLCQWGARGRALAGQTAEQIVGAYYPGARVQPAAAPETAIRVLIHAGLQPDETKVRKIVAQGGPWQMELSGAAALKGPPGGALELASDGAGFRYAARDASGAVLGSGQVRTPIVLRPLDGSTRFVVEYKPAAAVSRRPGAFYDTYRGEVLLYPNGAALDTVNRVALEDYLRGVVPAEMPASWPAEALKAQTYAARSYAVWLAKSRARERYDVDDTTNYQVYLGANAEQDTTNRIVEATGGQAIVYGGQVIQAYFFSTCAGWTENNESVWQAGPPIPYLRALHDVDASGRPYDADAPLTSWSTGALTVAQLEEVLNGDAATEIGKLLGLDLSQRTPSGRLLRVTLTGTAGIKTLRPDTLTARFNRGRPSGLKQLLSTNFELKLVPASALVETQGSIPATATAGPPPPTRTAVATPAPTGQPGQPALPAGTQPAAATPAPLPPLPPTPAPSPTPAYQLEMTQPAPAKPDGPTNAYFPETGHNAGGAFLEFYRTRGGLDLFGYPRTEELLEDGRTVQYFQRAVMEYHLDKAGTPYEVQLALLGDAVTSARRPFPAADAFQSMADHVYFPETGHGLHYAFLKYWRERGGLDVFGYPISEELPEPNADGSGRSYTVQYFQRARFEYHPEHAGTPYEVQLGLLGDQVLIDRLWLR
jgi:SpoIID/LytB domain protein